MTEAIMVSIISALATIIGVIISNRSQQRMMMAELEKKLELHEQKFTMQIESLTKAVSKHNNFAESIPVMQEQIRELQRTRPS